MNDNNENMSMLTFITKVYEICYYVQGIYTNCTRYMKCTRYYGRDLIIIERVEVYKYTNTKAKR